MRMGWRRSTRQGNVYAPEGPGLGVEFDWDWIEKHETGRQKFE